MTEEGLVIAAAELARRNPEGWKAFLHEFDVHARRLDYVMRHASHEGVHSAQGAAREASFLVDLLKGAVDDAEKIQNVRRNRGP